MKKSLLLFALLAATLTSCDKKDNNVSPKIVVPTVTTAAVTDITSSSAKGGGDVTADGGGAVMEKGVVWNKTGNPTQEDINSYISTDGGAGLGPFTATMTTDIQPSTLYHVRAYARNQAGSGYGADVTFTTTGPLPTVNTGPVTSITSTGGVVSSVVVSDGGVTVTARGLCYSTAPLPDITGSKTIDGSGTGSFNSTMTGLTTGVPYQFRAYATNANGTAYGTVVTFTPVLGVGENYQGGVIAYILQSGDIGYSATVRHGIIAAPTDQSTSIAWSLTNTTVGGTLSIISVGQVNTTAIVANQGAGTYAAKLCDDLVIGAYSDWYLPSLNELTQLYVNRTAIGGFAVAFYWSSTEQSNLNAWVQSFNSNSQAQATKSTTYNVRAVRSF